MDNEETDSARIRRMRNATAYQGVKNTIIEWMLSPKWSEIPAFPKVRGECVTRYISSKRNAKIVKIVANGAVSGEITITPVPCGYRIDNVERTA